MIDITYEKLSQSLIIYCFCIYSLIVSVYYKYALKRGLGLSKGNKMLFYFLVAIAIITICLDGDYFHYMEMVHEYRPYYGYHVESLYKSWLLPLVNNNYLLFRIIVWIGAFLITIKSFKLYKVGKFLSTFILFAIFITTFNYARATLGMAFFYLGIILLFNISLKRSFLKKTIYIIFSVLALWLAYEAHHSLMIAIATIPIAFFKFNKRQIFIIIFVVFPLLIIISRQFTAYLFQILIGSDMEYLVANFQGYSEKEGNFSYSIHSVVEYTLDISRFLVPISIVTYKLIKDKLRISPVILKTYNIVLAITIISFLTLAFSATNTIMFYRILYMTMIGVIIILSYFYKHKLLNRGSFKICILIGVLYYIYEISAKYYALSAI